MQDIIRMYMNEIRIAAMKHFDSGSGFDSSRQTLPPPQYPPYWYAPSFYPSYSAPSLIVRKQDQVQVGLGIIHCCWLKDLTTGYA